MKTLDWLPSIAIIGASVFTLWITIVSHLKLRHRKSDTVGRKTYRWFLIGFSVSGIIWGQYP